MICLTELLRIRGDRWKYLCRELHITYGYRSWRKDLFKCLVCGFLSEKYDDVDSHIREQHPDSKVNSIPWVPVPTEQPEVENDLEDEGIIPPSLHESFKRYLEEILPWFTEKDLDEIMLLIEQEKSRRKKQTSEANKSVLIP